MGSERILLCRPRGGLNDSLVQIELCWRHAARFKRTLVIDARRSGLRDRLDRYFKPVHESAALVLHPTEQEEEGYARLEVKPAIVSGRLATYETGFDGRWFFEAETKTPITFDMKTDHSEPLIVHEQCGGGRYSRIALARLRFLPEIAARVETALAAAAAGGPYDAVHIRHSDAKTDLGAFLEAIAPAVRGKRLLVCSDNVACVAAARETLKESDVFTVVQLPDLQGQPLHDNPDLPISQQEANQLMLTDLMAMAFARKVHVTVMTNGLVSGFGRLAADLSFLPGVRDSLLGRRTPRRYAQEVWSRAPSRWIERMGPK